MQKFIIEGGQQLHGEITPVGNKNAVLKLIPASILFAGDYTLTNVPGISDVDVMVQILEKMGAAINYDKSAARLTINTDNLNTHVIPKDLAAKLRSSVVFIGPLLARFGKVEAIFPGGDKIGPRELKAHFASLAQLGCQPEGNEWGEFSINGQPKAGEVYLYEPSVTATENVILAAATAPGVTKVVGAACEPHVQELCTWLQTAGVQIEGIGSNILMIHGKEGRLQANGEHAIWPDYIDVATAAVAAAITRSELTIRNVRHQDLITIKFFFEQMGLDMQARGDDLFIAANQKLELLDPAWGRVKGVYSQPWYSFPSDLMSIAIVLATQVKGSILFFEKLYPDRMAFSAAFNSAGGSIITCDPHRIVINGPSQLTGFKYTSPDLRAGMAYLLASMAASGKSEVLGVEHIERGYPGTAARYNQLGAKIEIIEV